MTTTKALLGVKHTLRTIWARFLYPALCLLRLGELNLTVNLFWVILLTDYFSTLGSFKICSKILINICIMMMLMAIIWDELWSFALGHFFLSLHTFYLVLVQGWWRVLVKWCAIGWIIHWCFLDSIQLRIIFIFGLSDVSFHAFFYFPIGHFIKVSQSHILMFWRHL